MINLSLGGAPNTQLDDAVAAATASGLTVIVAAGNNSADACSYSPARAPSAITIGATTSADGIASYSNTGSCVDLYAPGSGITSAWIGSSSATNTISGTSMATPHVAGLAARLAQAYPGITNSQIVSKLTANVVASPVPISTFAEPDPISTTTTVIDSTTTVPVVTTTLDPSNPTPTTLAPVPTVAPTTTVVAPTTTLKKVRYVPKPRGFFMMYRVVDGSTALTASWWDDRTPDTYLLQCARNRRIWREDETDEQSSAESIVIIERANVRQYLGGRSEATIVLPPSLETHCWLVAMIGSSNSRRSNVAILPRAPRVPVTTTTVPRTTTTTVAPTTTTTTVAPTTTTVAPTTTTVAPARVTTGLITVQPMTPPKIPTTTVRTTVTTKAPNKK